MNGSETCKSVLIIEDDEDIRDTLTLVVSQEGYRVHTAENGKVGIEMLQRLPRPCLILLDLMMPVMDGFEFLAALENHGSVATIPIVVVSAFDDLAKQASGVAGFVKKPVDLATLLDLVRRYCG